MAVSESFKRAEAMVDDPSIPIDLTGLGSLDRAWVLENRPDYNPDNRTKLST